MQTYAQRNFWLRLKLLLHFNCASYRLCSAGKTTKTSITKIIQNFPVCVIKQIRLRTAT